MTIIEDPTIPCSHQIVEHCKTVTLQEVLKHFGEILNIEKDIDGRRYLATILHCKIYEMLVDEGIRVYGDTPKHAAQFICDAITGKYIVKRKGWFGQKYMDLRGTKVVLE